MHAIIFRMPAKSNPAGKKRAKPLPLWLRFFFGAMALVFIAAGSVFGILLGYEFNLPKIQNLEDYRPNVITAVYSDDNKVIGEFAMERRIIAAFEDIPTYLQAAILAAEDDQFYNHSGVNYLSNIRAVYRDLTKMRRAEGASTITQQLARMLMNDYDKTFDRKIKELLITWKIEKRYSKQQILTLYCNLHNMGYGIYGVAAAADTYFGKQLKDLTLEECVMIAGLPRNPGLYSPRLHPNAALARRNYILDRMVAERMISPTLASEAKAKPLVLKQGSGESNIAPYFVEWVRQSLAEQYATDVIWRQGLRVYSTLNAEMQKSANAALQEGLRVYDKKRGWRGPIENILKDSSNRLETYTHANWRRTLRAGDFVVGLVENISDSTATIRIGKYRAQIGQKEIAWTGVKPLGQILKTGDLAEFMIVSLDDVQKTATVLLDQKPKVEGAIITIQNSTGEIKAMVGGYDYEASEFNRATQAMRQVGSTFKPFVYCVALEKGMTPENTIIDAPISFTDATGKVWQPSNYDGKFKGQITLRQAITESRNIPAVKTASLVGIKNVVVMARRFGLLGTLEPYLSLALGACEATPLEMASAFTVFPNLGMQAKPYFIKKIEDYDRREKEQNVPRVHKVLDPETAEAMLGMLQGVVQNGTATAAKSIGRPLGGKTGTTNDFTDAWFVGFSPSITTAVWVGFDEKVTLGNKESGSAVALPIWIDYMKRVLKDKPLEEFPSAEMTDQLAAESSDSPAVARKKLFIEDLPITTPASPKTQGPDAAR
jgi:penicillin-binding protein 1A